MFGFPSATRPEGGQFRRNLLKSVVFQVKFQQNDEIIAGFIGKRNVLKDKYPITSPISLEKAEIKFQKDKTPIVQTAKSSTHGYRFKTSNSDKILTVTGDSLSYTINGPAYNNFLATVSEIKQEFFHILNEFSVTNFNRIAIRKINLIEPKILGISNSDLLSLTFNGELVRNLQSFPDTSFISSGITNVTLENAEKRLNIVYGLLSSGQKKKEILLDIDLFLINQNIALGSLETTWGAINTEIFNIFNWAISNAMIDKIQTGDTYA